VRVLSLHGSAGAAGLFELRGESVARDEADDAWAGGRDVALMLSTSGTSAQPKLVPLRGSNLLASARNIARTLSLRPDDCCLNVMPLFHIHGLMAAVLATLQAGARVVCTDGSYGVRFFAWLEEFEPTWYSAVPTMHQAVLRQARDHAFAARRSSLRLIRSSSASLAPRLLHDLEDVFGVPVIEAYGMTEASHQVASNPLPPKVRKPGSVGLPAGPEIAIVDDRGHPLPFGMTGEVVIRGETVMSGYASGTTTEAAFLDGWFRTGDLGRFEEDGYLHLSGRLKELINRGGEKISPREIDEALLNHPAVRHAVAFAVPHRQLGDDIGVAVELKSGGAADERELRRYAAAVLPAFKIPRVIRIVDEIPSGMTGKVERSRLAAALAVAEIDDEAAASYIAPRNDVERRVVLLWQRLLSVDRVGVRDRFMALGGDSLLAASMLVEVSEAEGVDPPFTRFLDEGTVEAIAAEVTEWRGGVGSGLVAIQRGSRGRPLFCVPGHDGVLIGIARLARELGPEQRVWAFRFTEPARSIAELARRCVDDIQSVRRAEPYCLVGTCFGGLVAFEMARQLRQAGRRVDLLVLVDTLNPAWRRGRTPSAVSTSIARQLRAKLALHGEILRGMGPRRGARYLAGRVAAFLQNHGENAGARAIALGLEPSRSPRALKLAHRRLSLDYRPEAYEGEVLVVKVRSRRPDVAALGWGGSVQGRLEEVEIPFHPNGALAGPNARRVAQILSRRIPRTE
jgi:non-ribosomal peptide synthetase component E (peptide arylation enzyme)/thioesterase domain-containing protein